MVVIMIVLTYMKIMWIWVLQQMSMPIDYQMKI